MTREFKCCAGWNCCAGCEPCAMEIRVEAPVGQVIGYVRQQSVVELLSLSLSLSLSTLLCTLYCLYSCILMDKSVVLFNVSNNSYYAPPPRRGQYQGWHFTRVKLVLPSPVG